LLAHHAEDCAAWVWIYRDAGYDLEYSDHSGASASTDNRFGDEFYNRFIDGFSDSSDDIFNGSDDECGCNDFNVGFDDVSNGDFNDDFDFLYNCDFDSVFNVHFNVHNIECMCSKQWRRLHIAPFYIQHNASSNCTHDKHGNSFRYVSTLKAITNHY
jgi:hypothetical protein